MKMIARRDNWGKTFVVVVTLLVYQHCRSQPLRIYRPGHKARFGGIVTSNISQNVFDNRYLAIGNLLREEKRGFTVSPVSSLDVLSSFYAVVLLHCLIYLHRLGIPYVCALKLNVDMTVDVDT